MYVHTPIYVQRRFAEQSDNGAYGAAVESIDWATSVILHELAALGLADDTIVIFTSDNGSLGNDPVPVGGDGGLMAAAIRRCAAPRVRPGRVASVFPASSAGRRGSCPAARAARSCRRSISSDARRLLRSGRSR